MAEGNIEKGDQVSWQWGGGAPSGTVAEKKEEGELAIQSNKGNTIKKNAEPDNPAVHVERPGNDVVKRASELEIEEKANGTSKDDTKDDAKDESKDEPASKKPEKNGESETQVGDKRELAEDGDTEKGEEKKQKTEPTPKENGEIPSSKEITTAESEAKKEEPEEGKETEDGGKKKPGRPKKSSAKKTREPPPPPTEGIVSRTRSRAKAS